MIKTLWSKAAAKIGKLYMQNHSYRRNSGQKIYFLQRLKKKMHLAKTTILEF